MMNGFIPPDENGGNQQLQVKNIVLCILLADLAAFSVLGYNCYDRLDFNGLPDLDNMGKTITAIASQITFITVLYKAIWAFAISYSALCCDDDNWTEMIYQSATKTCQILVTAMVAVILGTILPLGKMDRHLMFTNALCLAFQFLSPLIIQYVCVA